MKGHPPLTTKGSRSRYDSVGLVRWSRRLRSSPDRTSLLLPFDDEDEEDDDSHDDTSWTCTIANLKRWGVVPVVVSIAEVLPPFVILEILPEADSHSDDDDDDDGDDDDGDIDPE